MADERINNGEEFEETNYTSVEEDIDDFDDFSDEKIVSEDEWTQEESAEKKETGLKRKKKIKGFFKKLLRPVIATVSVIAGVFFVLYICCILTLPQDTVANNVMIEDIDLSGMSYDDALSAIETADLFETQNISVECEGIIKVIDGRELGLNATPEATAQKAFNYGKSGNIIKDGFTAMCLIFSKKHIVPVADMDYGVLDRKLGELGVEVRGELKQVAVEITDTGAVITPGTSGFDHNTDIARKQVVDAMNDNKLENIHVTLKATSPDEPTLEYIGNAIYRDPIDAYYHISGKDIMVIKEMDGRYYNEDDIKVALPQIYEGGEKVVVPYYPSYPQVKAEELQSKLFAVTLGSYSTSFAPGGNRGKNVVRAASLINGTILAPGEEFSFNNTVGPRSKENGFFTAPEYVAGESVEGIGGGTCQVSTTLYSAVLYADMGITSRTEHMMTVGYAPLGQDATVAYGSIDFKFRNTTDYPVKIVAGANGSKLTVSIVGTQWDPPREVKLTHSKSMSGANTVVVSKRLVYANGELISTDPLDTSVYSPHKTPVPEPTAKPETTSAAAEVTSAPAPTSAPSSSGSAAEADIE